MYLYITFKTSKLEIKQQELNIKLILEATPIALLLINHEEKIIYLNRFSENLFLYQKAELKGRYLEAILPEIHRVKSPEFWEEYYRNPTEFRLTEGDELTALTNTGKQFPVEVRLNPIAAGQQVYVLVAVTDISGRIKINEQFRFIVESALHSMILTDSEGTISMVNKQTELLFGYERNELIGRKIEILVPQKMRHQHPAHRSKFYANPKARPMGDGRDLYGVRKDGTEIPLEIGLNPVEKDGERYVLASVIDITVRKTSEEAISNYARQIEEKNKELEEFTNVASHDLREPLNSIISLTDLLLDNKKDQLDEDGVRMLEFISKSSDRMLEMITGLLEYARIGKTKELVLTDLNELLVTVLLDLDATIKANSATVHVDPLPAIPAYAIELRLLFQNLISNAIKYRKPEELPVVRISAQEADHGWKFEVSDNGLGIPQNQKDKIFNLFHRLHARSKIEGTGIGLAHCRKITELHNGRIWVESELGKGSTFCFFIPSGIQKD